ncbi:MAG: MBL fold metallo-hydrolase [Deltaproteobacteria bacterium]|nr:MAG: MBL fold metallo-hydrolase [Deltaproteobacteria bacterium]
MTGREAPGAQHGDRACLGSRLHADESRYDATVHQALEEQPFGPVTVLYGDRRGRYPHGNTLIVRGRDQSLAIDPSLGLVARGSPPRVDRVLHSHCHEDHFAGSFLYPEAPWLFHESDLPGIRSLDGLMDLYGYPEPIRSAWSRAVVEQFHFTPRPDAVAFRGGDVFDLGGITVEAIHAPGHTRGHCFFRIEPVGLVYLADVDLSSFGPYTFHHIGVLEGKAAYIERLDRFAGVIADRERRLLEFLAEPRTLDDIVRHRFVYRPQDQVLFADGVERRTMSLHLARLGRTGRVREPAPGLHVRAAA